jgi:hypothetical protein
MVRAEPDKPHRRHKEEEDLLVQKLDKAYKKTKELNEEQDKFDRGDLKRTHEMLSTLYLLKYLKAERIKAEPIPDKPGYVEVIKWHEPIEWDEAKWGKPPNSPSLSSILNEREKAKSKSV